MHAVSDGSGLALRTPMETCATVHSKQDLREAVRGLIPASVPSANAVALGPPSASSLAERAPAW